jgi:hypothetical protein
MSDKAAKVPANNAVPCCALAAIKLSAHQYASNRCGRRLSNLFFDELSNVLNRTAVVSILIP